MSTTIRANTFYTILFLLLFHVQVTGQTFSDYQKLNDSETRLEAYKDDDRMLRLKLIQLEVINQSRKKYKAQPVKLDILASRAANKIAQEGAQERFMGHFNLKGENPWYRYAIAGGTDHVTENAAGISSGAEIPSADNDILGFMNELHQAFMAEKAPNDGHKQTCIHPHHNYVGIGAAWYKNEFRYYEEYLGKYLEVKGFNRTIKAGSKWDLSIKPISKSHHLWAVLVYHQPFPKPMSAKTVSGIPSYDDFGKTLVHNLGPWEIPAGGSNGFSDLTFTFKQKGLYYVQVYLSDKPYTKGKASTEGKISASGVVVEVK
ncbi:MAG: CAP domain-containing protein [Breznakibacter sp.]